MSATDHLDPVFAGRLKALLADCAADGVVLKPYFGRRDPFTQGRLWEQSRIASIVAAERSKLHGQGAPFLAACLDAARTPGPWATNALPGFSWHQWDVACDCVWLRAGAMCWSTSADGAKNGYRIYAAKAPAHGLTPLGPAIGDWDHVQLPREASPLHAYSVQEIDRQMAAKFKQVLAA